MEQILGFARHLGQKIAGHQRTALLKEAQKKLDQDSQAKELLEQYRRQAEKIAQLEHQQKPIEVEDKHKLREIEQNLSTNTTIAELSKRQADFVEMMHKVKQAIDNELKIDD